LPKGKEVRVGPVRLSNDRPFALIAGPCVTESEKLALSVARALRDTARRLGIPYIFKASYDKANRSSGQSFRGHGMREGLRILAKVKREVGVPVLTDVHSAAEVASAAQVADILQVPAFLCRQTDLLAAAARTGRAVNVKKGQFLAPADARNILKKLESAGNRNGMLTERGATFGYNNLIVDMRALEIMKSFGAPVVFDATHSVQLPGGLGNATGGQREFIYPLARAAVSVGVAAVFMEVHPTPERALSDGPNAMRLRHVPELLKRLKALDKVVKKNGYAKNVFL
jgi:2-dehydro-3-deoxyphosphooctonate aldolase (KDO 8-P synthase)